MISDFEFWLPALRWSTANFGAARRLAPPLRRAAALAGFCFLFHASPPLSGAPGQTGAIDTTGTLQVLCADDFEHRQATQIEYLEETGTGRRYRLRFPKPAPPFLRSGTPVRVRGALRENEIQVAPGDGAFSATTYSGAPQPLVGGSQQTILILVNFTNAVLGCSVATVSNNVFSFTQVSVNEVYRDSSFTNLLWNGIAVGPYTINYGSGVCDPGSWGAAADAAALAAGINLSLYEHKVYVLPNAGVCGWGGLGTIGGNPSQAWISGCDLVFQYAHEMGHNLGLYHSSTDLNNDGIIDLEYGDSSDFMSSCYCLTRLNAPHMVQMAWTPSNKMQALASPGTFQIAPLELTGTDTPLPQVLTFAIPGSAESYYISYRQPLGLDANVSSAYTAGVCIHRWCCGNTRLISTLSDGGSFSDTSGFTLRQVSHNGLAATVQFGAEAVPPPPAFLAMSASPDSKFSLNCTGAVGQAYYLLAASNLASPVFWSIIATNTAGANGAFTFSDLKTATFPKRFYRLEVMP